MTYNAAAAIMPDQKYPNDQISAIDKKVDSLAAAKNAEADRLKKEKEAQEMEAKYAAFIKTADGYLNQEDYIKAKSAYQQAASINNAASYPSDQIAKIEAALLEIADAEKFEEDQRKQYNQYITDGDRAVASQDWDKARESFNAALGIYSDEDVPKARLKEIDALEQKAKDEKLNAEIAELIRDADKFFVTKELEAAESKYQGVLDLDKTNQHAKVRLDKIKQIRAAQSQESIAEKDKPKRTVKEENFKEGNADVTVRTVTEGERVDIYKRVKHSWGGKYFFLNDQPISELVWNRDSVE